ncbi:MAG: TonB-dependent receptor [Oceanicaulis sp.]
MAMMKKLAFGASIAVLAAAAPLAAVHAQATTSALRGEITDVSRAPISGASVTIVHQPSGSVSATTTNAAGAFTASGLRVGGPYIVTISANGYQPQRVEGVSLTLGETFRLNRALEASAVTDVIVVTGSAIQAVDVAAGPAATFDLADIQGAPAINRDLSDVLRLDPRIYVDESFNNSIQCAGANPRYNSLTVDGLPLNDGFGLNSNGYPTQRMPFSFDAIEQVAVELAPFDVQYGGFTACNINAVTKSGENEFFGGVFYDYTDSSLQGDSLEGAPFDVASYDQKRYGVTFGGPIIRDRLFFFAAYEKFEGQDLFDRGPEGSGFATEVAGFTLAEFEEIREIAQTVYDYDPGGIPSPAPFEDESLLVRLDWEINNNHRLAFTYNQSEGLNLTESDGDDDEFEYFNHLYNRGSELASYSGQLFSDWSDAFSTEVRVTYTDVDFTQRSVNGTDFGEVQIRDGANIIYLGADDSRHSNQLNYTTLNMRALGRYQWNDHLITFGGERLTYDIFNLFVQETEGEWRFNSIADFRNGIVERVIYENAAPSNNPNDAAAEFSYDINTLFAQTDWTGIDNVTITAGLRYDFYTSDDTPVENQNFIARNGFSNAENLDGRGLLQPRFAAVWDATDALSLRAGFGLYSGGNPNVWISNNYSNNGITQVERVLRETGGTNLFTLNFVEDEGGLGRPIWGIPQSLFDGVATGTANSATNAIDPDFEIPSEWKFALGFTWDGELPYLPMLGEFTIVGDYLRSETRDAAGIIDATLEQIDTAPDGRPIYRRIDRSDPDCAVDPASAACSSRGFNNDFILTNFGGGKQDVLSIAASQEFDNGLAYTFAYAFVDSEDSNPMTSSVAFSNYANIAVSDPNNPGAATSNYEIPHRFTLRLKYEREFFGDLTTRATLFGQMSQSRPYSFVFTNDDGDIFGDAVDFRHLVYVPTGPTDPLVQFAPTFDTDAFFAYVDANGLPRGEIAGRNAFEGSWWTKFDLRLEQELPGLLEGHRSSVYMVVENLGNFLNDEWGILRQASFPQARGIVNAGYDAAANQYIYESFSPATPETRVSSASTWQILFGAKYEF